MGRWYQPIDYYFVHPSNSIYIGVMPFFQTCERSLTPSTCGPAGPSAPSFVRGQVLPSGFLIRPCDGGGSMIHIVDHIDLDVSFLFFFISLAMFTIFFIGYIFHAPGMQCT